MLYSYVTNASGVFRGTPRATAASFHPKLSLCNKRRQPKRVPAILDAENAQHEAVHAQHDRRPHYDGHLLPLFVGNARDSQS